MLPARQIGVCCHFFFTAVEIRCNIPSRRGVRSWFIYFFEVWTEERESAELSREYDGVED